MDSSERGSVLKGFFIGLMLIITSALISWLIIANSFENNSIEHILLLAISPAAIVLLFSMVWFGWKGKSRIIYGILASIAIAVVSLPLLLVAACFGMFN
jgi:hypothetical protein